MNKLIPIALIIGLLLGVSAILAPPIMASPPIKRPMDLYDITIKGGSPESVDYAWIYDTASAEILQSTMDTLLMWSTESSSAPYIFALATSESDYPFYKLTTLNVADLSFENGAQLNGTNFAQYYWQYDFKIRQGVLFAPPYNYSLTTADVAYSFQRELFQDRASGPQWMLDEPLLDNSAGMDGSIGGLVAGDISGTNPGCAEAGALVQNAVGFNATDVWFNIMFPGAYAPFLQILCQSWASITSKQWVNNQVIAGAGRADWDGSFANITSWTQFWNPPNSPWDKPTPMGYGSGPFILTPGTPDYTANFWSATRNPNWWGGFPAFYPIEAGAQVAGYANTIEVSWNYAWSAAQGFFKSGDCDFAALPSLASIGDIYTLGYTGSYYPSPASSTNLPLAGIRGYANLPELEVDALFYTMNISSATPYGPISAPVGAGPASFPSTGIPSNFFGNEPYGNPYGIHMRKAFSYAIDYAQELAVAALGEGFTPATAIIPGLYGYNASIISPYWGGPAQHGNLTLAAQEFAAWPNLMTNGFTITLAYNTGNAERQELCQLIQTAVQSISPNFHITIVNVDWSTYLHYAVRAQLSTYVIGWLVDFPDPHDFALPFYHTGGAFASWQKYSNATMDAMIDTAITLPNGPARALLYSQIANLALADVPSVTVITPVGRHFEYDWINDWYYNPIYPGHNFYNEYKFYYVPEANQATQAQPFSEYLPADVNRDGTVNMKDIASIARAFGSSYTQPIPASWQFVDDLVNIRTINMKAIGFVARQFGISSPIGTFGPLVTINHIVNVVTVGTTITFTATLPAGYGNSGSRVIKWYTGTQAPGQNPAPTLVGSGTTYSFTAPAGPSESYVFCQVTDTFTGAVATARGIAGLSNTAVATSQWAGVSVL